jgi:hypothetical protein
MISCDDCDGQADPYRRAAVQDAFDGKVAFMSLHNVFDDRQAQTGAADLSRAGLVDSVKSLGKTGQVFFRNADAGVDDGEFDV